MMSSLVLSFAKLGFFLGYGQIICFISVSKCLMRDKCRNRDKSLIFIQLYVKDFVFAAGYACVPALMVLVAIVAADELHLAFRVDGYLVNVSDANALALELLLCLGFFPLFAVVDESVFAQLLLFCLQFLRLLLENSDDAIAGDEVFHGGEFDDESASLWPFASVGGSRIPWQSEEVTASHGDVAVLDDAFLVFLVEEQAP